MQKWFFVLIWPILFAACSGEQSDDKEATLTPEEIKENQLKDELIGRGETISGELKKVLQQKLQQAIGDSGISYALQFCKMAAYPLTDSLSAQHNVKIKRVSHKPRNPQNLATPEEIQMIMSADRLQKVGGAMSPLLKDKGDHYTFYNPILISSPLCLKCHGIPDQDITPKDFIVINMLYPDDQATGFGGGQVRGLWRIDFPKDTLQAL